MRKLLKWQGTFLAWAWHAAAHCERAHTRCLVGCVTFFFLLPGERHNERQNKGTDFIYHEMPAH